MKMQFQRMCSALLAAIMVVTAVPGTQLTSYAAETAKENSIVTNTEVEDDSMVTMEETTGVIQFEYGFQKNIGEEEQ